MQKAVGVDGARCRRAQRSMGMADETYRIVFYGEVALWSDVDESKRNIARMFKVDAATVDRMFKARPAVIKSGIDHATAVKYKISFEKTGAVCVIEPVIAVTPAARPAAPDRVEVLKQTEAADERAAAPTESPDSMICPKCGQRQPESAECAHCGIIIDKYVRQQSAPPPIPQGAAKDAAGDPERRIRSERTWAMLCHLSALAGCILPLGNILGPLAVWLLKKDESPFIDEHGKAALNFQVTVSLALLLAIPVSFLGITKYVVIPLVVILLAYILYVIILSAVKAHRGEDVEIRPSIPVLR
jgi:uncharacterized protein